jgi:hypothetical protein
LAGHRRTAIAVERERCARVAEGQRYGDIAHDAETQSNDDCCASIAAAIRQEAHP